MQSVKSKSFAVVYNMLIISDLLTDSLGIL